MSQFFLQRLATLIATLAVASLVVFGVLEVLPGNAAQTLLGPDADPEAVAALAAQLGLDQPAWQRYLQWVHGLLTGALGDSHAYGSPVAELILERLQLTIPLAVLAMLLAAALALGAGVYAAAHHQRPGDWGLMGLAQIGIALPNFWFAILLILLFAVQLQWFPAGGFPGWRAEDGGGLWPGLHALVLPALSLAVVQGAILALQGEQDLHAEQQGQQQTAPDQQGSGELSGCCAHRASGLQLPSKHRWGWPRLKASNRGE